MTNQDPNLNSNKSSANVYSVSSLVRKSKQLLETEIGTIWIEGEISNLARPASGHLYFTLKDDKCQIRCALFKSQLSRLLIRPENGQLVKARARVSLYEPRGEYQLIVETLEPAGAGALQQAFEKLKLKLKDEGLFSTDDKQELPVLPKRIGVITSPSGAVIHDILTTLQRRFPAIKVLLFPVPVQGDAAAPKIIEALSLANKQSDCDVLILARGGGSLEDLWAFNEESLARAIYDSEIPVVSSIGHETDFTIADFVADARAPTPTAAAEMLSPNAADWLKLLSRFEAAFIKLSRDYISQRYQTLDIIGRRLVSPAQRIQSDKTQLQAINHRLELVTINRLKLCRARLNSLPIRLLNVKPSMRIQRLIDSFMAQSKRLRNSTDIAITNKGREMRGLVKRLNTLNPLETLGRGFAILYKEDSKTVVDSVQKIVVGEHGLIRVADGKIKCLFEETSENK